MDGSLEVVPMTDSASTPLLEGAAGTWRLDPSNTTIEIHTKAIWGLAKVKGTFSAVSGNGALGDHGSISGELVVDAGSIDTRNKRRDKHLRGADFFDVGKYPTLTFTASEVAPAADGTLKINGALRIRDRSQPIELIAIPTNPSPDRVTLNAEATVDRSKWGMTWRKGASMVNRIAVTAQFVRA
jgi:polyisoprenoid-binding protein YceI